MCVKLVIRDGYNIYGMKKVMCVFDVYVMLGIRFLIRERRC